MPTNTAHETKTDQDYVDLAMARYRAADDVLRVVEHAVTLERARDKAREVCEGFWRDMQSEQRKAARPKESTRDDHDLQQRQ